MGTLVHRNRSALRGQTIAKVEARSLQLSISMENCPQNHSKTCRNHVGLLRRSESEIRFEALQGPFRNGVPTGEGMSSVRL